MGDIRNHRRRRRSFLYFVEAPTAGRIKIGIASDFRERFASLRNGSPIDLAVALVVRGTARHEWALHGTFADERLHGEWFTASERLRAFIYDLKCSSRGEVAAKLDAVPYRKIAGIRGSYANRGKRIAATADELAFQKRLRIARRKKRQAARAQRLWAAVEQAWRAAS